MPSDRALDVTIVQGTSVQFGGSFLIMGGVQDGAPKSDMYYFNPASLKFVPVAGDAGLEPANELAAGAVVAPDCAPLP